MELGITCVYESVKSCVFRVPEIPDDSMTIGSRGLISLRRRNWCILPESLVRSIVWGFNNNNWPWLMRMKAGDELISRRLGRDEWAFFEVSFCVCERLRGFRLIGFPEVIKRMSGSMFKPRWWTEGRIWLIVFYSWTVVSERCENWIHWKPSFIH